MRDKGDMRYREVHLGCRLVLACVLASGLATESTHSASAQAREQIITNPRYSDQNNSASVAVDPLELSQDQAVWTALAFEDNDLLRKLLKSGANPNTTEVLSLMTPLMAAETLQLAWTLVENGANPKARDRMGRTPLHYAPKMRDGQLIIPLLVRAGGEINARSNEPGAITPLFCAIENYLETPDKKVASDVVRTMVRYGADINATDSNGATVLAIAAAHNKADLIKLLVELGADPAKRLSNGRTPLDYAREANALEVIKLLGGTTGGTLSGN